MSPPARVPPASVLVVGAGLAATQTVAALRSRGFAGHVRVLGAEGVPPYDRPPLSKHLLDRTEPAWLTGELGVDLADLADDVRWAEPARELRLDGPGVAVATDDGTHAADVVVLATGAHAVRPGGWDAARTLHSAADAAGLRPLLRPGTRLVVVGAGWIGAEVATVATAAGVDVQVVEAAASPLPVALGAVVGGWTAPWYAAGGVALVTGVAVEQVRADGVRMADGTELPADVVLAAVGARPTTAWLAGAVPLDADGSVRVDEHGVVAGADPRVRAVGDVARRWSPRFGWVPGGHWDGALRGPDAVVADLLGLGPDAVPTPDADPAPYVFSTQLGHELALYGRPRDEDDVVPRGDPTSPDGWTALWFRGGTDTLTAVLTVDRPHDVGAARRLLATPPPGADPAALPRLDRTRAADPSVRLRDATV